MSQYVPLFLSQEVSDRSQAKRWSTVRPGRRQRVSETLASLAARLIPGRQLAGRHLVPVDLARPADPSREAIAEPTRSRQPVGAGSAPCGRSSAPTIWG
jgi:hypothetical protein